MVHRIGEGRERDEVCPAHDDPDLLVHLGDGRIDETLTRFGTACGNLPLPGVAAALEDRRAVPDEQDLRAWHQELPMAHQLPQVQTYEPT
jgi:hypothetical protein